MPPDPPAVARWTEISRVVDGALRLAPGKRAAFVGSACGGDAGLRREVERLLLACQRAGDDEGFLTTAGAYAEPVLRDLAARDAAAHAAIPAALERVLAGRYAMQGDIGRGAMATVYLAHDLKFDRSVAIKVLRPELSRDADVRHFQREIERTAKLTHPHIVPVIDSGTADGLLYYLMPYLDGGTLRHRLTRDAPLPLGDAIAIASTIARALDYAHRHGLVHRDVKPENILFTEREPWLADFGIARALDRVPEATWSSIGILRGTPPYMSPEQVRAETQLDARTDVYALACVLYEMLAGRPPFTGRTDHVVLQRQLHDPPPPLRVARPDVADSVERAIVRALAKDPADRPTTAAAFATELRG